MKAKNHQLYFDLSFLIVAIGALFFLFLGRHSILLPEEANYTEIAREMVRSGNYLTPHLHGIIFIDKPILYYWLESLAISLFGLNEWALRFWPAIIGVLGAIFTYLAGRILFNRRTGIVAALLLATTPLYYAIAHFANMDLEAAVFISCSLFSFLIAIQEAKTKNAEILWMLAAYVFSALAFLTKGLIGIAFPIMIIGLWILILNRWSTIKRMHLIIGALLFFAITAPWYILEQRAVPDFFHYFFVIQNFSRYLVTTFNNNAPFWFYVPVILAGMIPWSFFIVQAILHGTKTIKQKSTNYQNLLFMFIWAAAVLLFFSIPTSKLVGYIIPILPPLALIIGNYFDKIWSNRLQKLFLILLGINILLIAVGSYYLDHFNPKSIKPIALKLKPQLQPNDMILTFHNTTSDLPIYLDRNIFLEEDWQRLKTSTWKDDLKHLLLVGLNFQNGQGESLIDDTNLAKLWHSKKRLFIFTRKDRLDDLQALLREKVNIVDQLNDQIVISNN